MSYLILLSGFRFKKLITYCQPSKAFTFVIILFSLFVLGCKTKKVITSPGPAAGRLIELTNTSILPPYITAKIKRVRIDVTFQISRDSLNLVWESNQDLSVNIEAVILHLGLPLDTASLEVLYTDKQKFFEVTPQDTFFDLTYNIPWEVSNSIRGPIEVCVNYKWYTKDKNNGFEDILAQEKNCSLITSPKPFDGIDPIAKLWVVFPENPREGVPIIPFPFFGPPFENDPLNRPKVVILENGLSSTGLPQINPASDLPPIFGEPIIDQAFEVYGPGKLLTNYRFPTIVAKVKDEESGIATVKLLLNEVELNSSPDFSMTSDGEIKFPLYPRFFLREDENIIRLEISDKAGNVSVQEITIIKDEQPPEIEEVVPADGVVLQQLDSLFFSIRYSDLDAGIDVQDPESLKVYLKALGGTGTIESFFDFQLGDGSAYSSIPWPELMEFVAGNEPWFEISDGRIDIIFYVMDRVGNFTIQNFYFYVTEVPEDIIQKINQRIEATRITTLGTTIDGTPGWDGPKDNLLIGAATMEEAFSKIMSASLFYYDDDTGLPITLKDFFVKPKYADLLTSDEFDALFMAGNIFEVLPTALEKISDMKADPDGIEETANYFRDIMSNLSWLNLPYFESIGESKTLGDKRQCGTSNVNQFWQEVKSDNNLNITQSYKAGTGVNSIEDPNDPGNCNMDGNVSRELQTFPLQELKISSSIEKIISTRFYLEGESAPPQPAFFQFTITEQPVDIWGDLTSGTNVSGAIPSNPGTLITPLQDVPLITNKEKDELPDLISILVKNETSSPQLFPSTNNNTGGSYSANLVNFLINVEFVDLPITTLFPAGNITLEADMGIIPILGEYSIFDDSLRIRELIPDSSFVEFRVYKDGFEITEDLLNDSSLEYESTPDLGIGIYTFSGQSFFELDLRPRLASRIDTAGNVFKVTAKLIEIKGNGTIENAPMLETGEITIEPGKPDKLFILTEEEDVMKFPEFFENYQGTIAEEPIELPADGNSTIPIKVVAIDTFGNLIKDSNLPVRWDPIGDFEMEQSDLFMSTRGEASAVIKAGFTYNIPILGDTLPFETPDFSLSVAVGTLRSIPRSVKLHEISVSVESIQPITDLKILKKEFTEITFDVTCPGLSNQPVADGTEIEFFATKGTAWATTPSTYDLPFIGTISSGKATCKLITETLNPYQALNPGFEKSGISTVYALVGEARAEQDIELLWPEESELRVDGTPVIIGDRTSPGTVDILQASGELFPVPYETSTDIVISGTPGKQVQLGFERNYLPKLNYRMDRLDSTDVVYDHMGNHDGVATNITMRFDDFGNGKGAYYFNGDAFLEIPFSADLQLEDNLVLDIAVYLDTLFQEVNLVRNPDAWNLFVDQKGFVHFETQAIGTEEEIMSLTPLAQNAWHTITVIVENGLLKLGINNQFASLEIQTPLPVSTSSILLGESLIGKLDNFEFGSTLDKLLQTVGPSTVNLDATGTAVVTVFSTGILSGEKYAMRSVFLTVTGSPTVRKPISVASLETFQAFAEIGESIFGNIATGAELLISFTIIGDIIDVGNFLIDLWPGGDSPDFLIGGAAIISLVTEAIPAIKSVGDAIKHGAKTRKRVDKVGGGAMRSVQNANRRKDLLKFVNDNEKALGATDEITEALHASAKEVLGNPKNGDALLTKFGSSLADNENYLNVIDDLRKTEKITDANVRSAIEAINFANKTIRFSKKSVRCLARISSILGDGAGARNLIRKLSLLKKGGRISPASANKILEDLDDVLERIVELNKLDNPVFSKGATTWLRTITQVEKRKELLKGKITSFKGDIWEIKLTRKFLTSAEFATYDDFLIQVMNRANGKGPDLLFKNPNTGKGILFDGKNYADPISPSAYIKQTKAAITERIGVPNARRKTGFGEMELSMDPFDIETYVIVVSRNSKSVEKTNNYLQVGREMEKWEEMVTDAPAFNGVKKVEAWHLKQELNTLDNLIQHPMDRSLESLFEKVTIISRD